MLERFSAWLAFDLLRLSPSSRLGEAAQFFLADTLKISILLFIMIFLIGVARTWLPEKTMKSFMSRRGWLGNLYASLFGAITPFCSCSSIPIFFAMLRSGLPLGVTFSFLITSPVINEYLVVLMLGFFGWKITLAYVVSGILVGTVSGLILGRMGLEKHLESDITGSGVLSGDRGQFLSFRSRLLFGLKEANGIIKKAWLWILGGVALGAFIHNYVPQEAVDSMVRSTGVFSVPLAVLVGVPMYGSCAAIVPIAVALFQKGVPLGTALAFMMATSALSLPEAVLLRRAMRLRLILIFFGITTLAIIMTGYLFNALQTVLL